MDTSLIIFIGISLAMDCFAVSLAAGTSHSRRKFSLALILGTFFGVFQAGMMLMGWGLGSALYALIMHFDHWIAFAILSLIGVKMIYEGIRGDADRMHRDYFAPSPLVILAVATSIDSLGVGLSLAFVEDSILAVAVAAGAISFIFSFAGAMLGGVMTRRFGEKTEILGGVILIGIGIRILLEHSALL